MQGLGGTYAVWAAWLEAFARGEDRPLDDMPSMREDELGAVAAERLVVRLRDAVNGRLELSAAQLNRDVEAGGDAAHLRRGLDGARRRIAAVRTLLASDKVFPSVREALSESLARSLTAQQAELERQARGGGRGDELLLRIVLEHPLDRPFAEVPLAPAPPPCRPAGPRTATTSHRRVLLG